MKIKRFNNLWSMGLILSAVILGAIYILKIFMPQLVIEIAHIDSIVRIGHYIDSHKWVWYLSSILLSYISYYFICCGCCKKKKLTRSEILLVLATIVILLIVKELLPNQYTSCNISSMILLPYIMKADFKATTISFISISFLQTITLEIRNLQFRIIDFNFATLLILMIDIYIFEFLLYSLFNFKESKNGTSKPLGIW